MSKNWNAINDLVELQTWLRRADDSATLHASLRIAAAVVERQNGSISVELRKAFLEVEYDGLEPAPGSRLGDKEILPSKSSQTRKRESSAEVGIEASAESDAIVPLKGKGHVSLSTKNTTSSEKIVETSKLPIRSLPGSRWRIEQTDGRFLDGTFLSGEQLCTFDIPAQTNRSGSNTELYANAKDINVQFTGNIFEKLTSNKSSLLAILFCKTVNTKNNIDYNGKIVISSSESEC